MNDKYIYIDKEDMDAYTRREWIVRGVAVAVGFVWGILLAVLMIMAYR